jgi:hypothetical protein
MENTQLRTELIAAGLIRPEATPSPTRPSSGPVLRLDEVGRFWASKRIQEGLYTNNGADAYETFLARSMREKSEAA